MARLEAAHRGYEYQDLLVAGRFVDVLLGSVLRVHVDEKLVPDDRFDDLTTVDIAARRERVQFKHTENDDRPLAPSTFSTDSKGLRLDRVIAAMLADRSGPGLNAPESTFRIILRDQPPKDPELTAVLTTFGRDDPGPFLPGMGTVRLGFDAHALWNQRGGGVRGSGTATFGFLFTNEKPLRLKELKWACQHLVIEVNAPPASGDLTAPRQAERLLLARVLSEVGAEAFPNNERSAIDVSAAMVASARAARQGRLEVTASELLRRARLRSDFGAVSRAHPVDRALEVSRPSTVRRLIRVASEVAEGGGHLLIVGPPGHGKSWICQQLFEALFTAGWLVAEHYCYLGDADGERLERVIAENVFGSLVSRLADADPRLVAEQRPRFAADEETLSRCVLRSLEMEPKRKIALVVDGIDHISRVRVHGEHSDPSRSLAEALSALDLPQNCVVIVLSQPGTHLEPLEQVGAKSVGIPGLGRRELESLAVRFNIVPSNRRKSPIEKRPLLEDDTPVSDFLDALLERSAGNALYTTYLCRETLRAAEEFIDPAAAIRSLPPFDGTLQNYYDHLRRGLSAEAGWVADVIALVDFAVTRAELRQIRPDAAHRVDEALAVLRPVLIERATQGGLRVYHESFARFLRKAFRNEAAAHQALLGRIADWLDGKGLFSDPRAFRSLLAILAEAGRDKQVVDLVDRTFVIRAVAAGFPSMGIAANLATAVGSASRLGDWAAIVRFVELSRAAVSYQSERYDSMLVTFADVPASLLGPETLAARLVDDVRLLMPARAGLQMCAAVDALGAAAPWREYMAGYLREIRMDNTLYGEPSDRAVALAWLRGRLRLASMYHGADSKDYSTFVGVDDEAPLDSMGLEDEGAITEPIDWNRLARWIEDNGLPMQDVVGGIADTRGLNGVIHLIHSLQNPGDACLALAENLALEPERESTGFSPRIWATAAAAHGVAKGSMYRLLRLGVDPEFLELDPIEITRNRLLDLTRRIQKPSAVWDEACVADWLDVCTLAAHRDRLGMNAAEALIVGDGWYRCWLRFALMLSRAEAAQSAERGTLALEALRFLTDDLSPFTGDPRSCDLYSLHVLIRDTIGRAMELLDGGQWPTGLDILKKVSASITTTLSGELGGPVPPDFVLHIAVDNADQTRSRAAEALIHDEIARSSARRLYSDLAQYRLLAARLALRVGEKGRAECFWHEACTFLTAYGYHKDITIYEVLDPLPALIKANPGRARICVGAVQGLCERVPLHTDGRETRHAWSRWWELLAKADPVSAVHLAVPQLLRRCNDPNRLLNDALEDIWREWHEQADPLIAGALRLTLDTPLDRQDVNQLECLANSAKAEGHGVQQLMTWLLARADERPVAYLYTNSAELIAQDDQVVAGLNEIARRVALPAIGIVREEDASGTEPCSRDCFFPSTESSIGTASALDNTAFPPGLPGLLRAIRVWHRLPSHARSVECVVEQFANAIGYRLIELAQDEHQDDVRSALRALVGGSGLGEQSAILRSIAEGLERHGKVQLSAIAYALTWTQARGNGGWLTFGGQKEIEALRKASSLDSPVACSIVAEEIQRVVASGYWSYGISQAIIYAFACEGLKCTMGASVDAAFAAWNEALAVISSRAPRVDVSDDPEPAYVPSEQDDGQIEPADLQTAMSLATLGALAHPGREKKRRALLAARLLLEERAAIAAPAFEIALGTISDPATLTWLLRLMESSGEASAPVRTKCQKTLRELGSRNLITVRALARRLILGDKPPLGPPDPADTALLGGGTRALWTPDQKTRPTPEEAGLDEFLGSQAEERLRRGERLLPGLTKAVRARFSTSVSDDGVRRRLDSQLNAFADRLEKRWPDAFLVHEEMIETILQSVATGGRAARLMAGDPVTDPISLEDELASALLDDPAIPLSLEAWRQPRPLIPLPPGRHHHAWARVRERASEVHASGNRRVIIGTFAMEPIHSVPTVEGGAFSGWRWIATMERRRFQASESRHSPDLIAERYRVLEVRALEDDQSLVLPPVAPGDLRMWRVNTDPESIVLSSDRSAPLVGLDRELELAGDGRQGLGVPGSLLVPTPFLVAILKLHSGTFWTFDDEAGAALALVTWRAEYDTSEHYLAFPRTCGAGIVIRPDLLGRLVAVVGGDRLLLRDFIIGDMELLSEETSTEGGSRV